MAVVMTTKTDCITSLSQQQLTEIYTYIYKGKGKAVPLQAWTGPKGSQEVKVPGFRDNGTGRW